MFLALYTKTSYKDPKCEHDYSSFRLECVSTGEMDGITYCRACGHIHEQDFRVNPKFLPHLRELEEIKDLDDLKYASEIRKVLYERYMGEKSLLGGLTPETLDKLDIEVEILAELFPATPLTMLDYYKDHLF